MSTLIRRNGADAELAAPPWRTLSPESVTGAIDPVIADYVARIEELESTVAGLKQAHKAELTQSYEQGGDDARAAFKRDEADALQLLGDQIVNAKSAFDARLDQLETLAPLMCRTVLENLLSDADGHTDLIQSAIDCQMQSLRRESVIAIVVSAADFTDVDALRALEATYTGLQVRADASLVRGDCRIELRLGQIDLSLAAYRQEVAARLQALADTP